MRLICTLLLSIWFTVAFSQNYSPEQKVDMLGVSKKGTIGLEIKPGNDYAKTKKKLLKKRPDYLFYDKEDDVFSIVFSEDGGEYADIKFTVNNGKIVGAYIDVYLNHTAESKQLQSLITTSFRHNYKKESGTKWSGSGLDIDFYDGKENGHDGFVIQYVPSN